MFIYHYHRLLKQFHICQLARRGDRPFAELINWNYAACVNKSELPADSFHRRLDQPRDHASSDGAGERLSDRMGQDSRYEGLHEHQRQSDRRLFRLLSTVLVVCRSETDVWGDPSSVAENVNYYIYFCSFIIFGFFYISDHLSLCLPTLA